MRFLQLSAIVFIHQDEPEPRLASLKVFKGRVDILKRVLLVPRVKVLLDGELEHAFDLRGATDERTGDGSLLEEECRGREGHRFWQRADEDEVAVRAEEIEVDNGVKV